MNHAAAALALTEGQRRALEIIAKSATAPHRDVVRARALLLAADGVANTRITEQAGVSVMTVRAWRERFATGGLAKFGRMREGRGRKVSIPAEKVEAIVHATLHEKPPGETHWSCRSMAKAQGVSKATVQRIWKARGLQPHRVETFKLPDGKRFEEKLVDVVGLYLIRPTRRSCCAWTKRARSRLIRGTNLASATTDKSPIWPSPASIADKLSGEPLQLG